MSERRECMRCSHRGHDCRKRKLEALRKRLERRTREQEPLGALFPALRDDLQKMLLHLLSFASSALHSIHSMLEPQLLFLVRCDHDRVREDERTLQEAILHGPVASKKKYASPALGKDILPERLGEAQ